MKSTLRRMTYCRNFCQPLKGRTSFFTREAITIWLKCTLTSDWLGAWTQAAKSERRNFPITFVANSLNCTSKRWYWKTISQNSWKDYSEAPMNTFQGLLMSTFDWEMKSSIFLWGISREPCTTWKISSSPRGSSTMRCRSGSVSITWSWRKN